MSAGDINGRERVLASVIRDHYQVGRLYIMLDASFHRRGLHARHN
ncbi:MULTISPECIES: hypothetical protein [Raoultella]|nr:MULTISPECIES: hypothetical protein [Raoultella]MDX7500668.1 hypothetical protein [Raoultella ornithinolytica]